MPSAAMRLRRGAKAQRRNFDEVVQPATMRRRYSPSSGGHRNSPVTLGSGTCHARRTGPREMRGGVIVEIADR